MDKEKADIVDINCQKVFGDSLKSASADLDDAETIPFTVFCFRVGNCQATDRQKVTEIFRSEGIDLLLLDSTNIRTEVVATVNLPGDYRDLSGTFVERLLETRVTREYWNCSGCEFKNNLARFKCLNCDLEKTPTRTDKAAQSAKLTGSCDSEDRLKVALSALKLHLLNFDFSIRLEPFSIRELRNLPCLPKVQKNGLYSLMVEYENGELYSLKRTLQSIPHYKILQGENEKKVQFEHHEDALQAYFHLKEYRLEFQSRKDLPCLCPIETKLASLTEKNLCSLIFKKTQKNKNAIHILPENIKLLIYLCPDIIVSHDEEGVVWQFPSPRILSSILKCNGTEESNTVEKVKALAQRFQIVRFHDSYMIQCYHGISHEIASFLNENKAGSVVNNNLIAFSVKLDLFRFLVRFSRTDLKINSLCIQYVAPNNNTTQPNYTAATYQSGDSQTTKNSHILTSDNVVLAKGDVSVLTEKNLCSMIFKHYLKYRNKKVAFAKNLRDMIRHCPDIIVASTEESIVLKFPSPEILTSILNFMCSQESNSLEKINTLPERFRLRATPLWVVKCKINIIDLSDFLQTRKAIILDHTEPVLIGFKEKKSAFQFLVKFWYLGPIIHCNNFIEDLGPTQGNHPTRQVLPTTSLVPSEHVSTSTSSSITLNPDIEVFTPIQLNVATSPNASKDSSAPTDNPQPMEITIGLVDKSLEDEEENKLVSIHNECIEERTGFLFHPNSICFLYPVEINMNHTSQPEIPHGILSTNGPVMRVTRTQNGFLRVWYSQRYEAVRTVKLLKDRYDIKQLRIDDICGQELQEEGKGKEMELMILFSSSTNQDISSEFCGSRIYKNSKGWVLLFEDPSLLFQAFYTLLRDKQYEDVDIQPLSFIFPEMRSHSDLFTLQIYPQSSTQIQVHEDAIVEGELYSFINKGDDMFHLQYRRKNVALRSLLYLQTKYLVYPVL